MPRSVAALLARVVEDDAGLSDVCVKLGLLLERYRSIDAQANDGKWNELLGDEMLDITLDEGDYNAVIQKLIAYVSSSSSPDTAALWALEKSRDERVIPHFLRIARQVSPDIAREALAHQAVHGVIVLGVHSIYRDDALTCLREVAATGSPEIKEEAVKYLLHYQKTTKRGLQEISRKHGDILRIGI